MGKTSPEVTETIGTPRVTSVVKQRNNDEALESTRVAKCRKIPKSGATAVPGSHVVVQKGEALGPQEW